MIELTDLPLEEQIRLATASERLAWDMVVAADNAADGLSSVVEEIQESYTPDGEMIFQGEFDEDDTTLTLVGPLSEEYAVLRVLLTQIDEFYERMRAVESAWVPVHNERKALRIALEDKRATAYAKDLPTGRYVSKQESHNPMATIYVKHNDRWWHDGYHVQDPEDLPIDLIPLTAVG